VYVSEVQRARLLDAAFAVVAEQGYRRMTVRRVSGWAGVSNKTFYDLFSDREDCFLAAFDCVVEQLTAVVAVAWEGEREWAARVRAALGALLAFLDAEPARCLLVFVEALGAGPRVLARRAEVLESIAVAVDEGRVGVRVGRELPPLTAEGIVGAAFGVIYARLIQDEHEPLVELLNALMATIVLPYRGHAAAARELARLVPGATTDGPRATGGKSITSANTNPGPLGFRLTVRTQLVLAAIAELEGRGLDPSNRQIADTAGVADQGQISKLLARLEGLGLLTNTGGQTQGAANAWQLTHRGEEFARVGHTEERNQFTEVIRADGSFDPSATTRQDIVNKGEASPC
jgi:AcrR family transcriptional regulator/DNA-binding MarR family transcriptional regulator